MSALDQAFIKAYAKDIPAAPATARPSGAALAEPSPAAAAPAARVRRAASQTPSEAHVIEQMYHDGSLYRADAPAASPRRVSAPAPHYKLPPRSSPQRNVRRSMLKLLEQIQDDAPPAPAALRPVRQPAPKIQAELPPETIVEQPRREAPPVMPAKVIPTLAPAAPVTPPAPVVVPRQTEVAPRQADAAPLNLAKEFAPQFNAYGGWAEAEVVAIPTTLVLLAEPDEIQLIQSPPLVELRLDALPHVVPAKHAAAARAPAAHAPAPIAAPPAKIEEVEQQPVEEVVPLASAAPKFRLDEPHATRTPVPHVKFAPPPAPAAEIIEEPITATAVEERIEATVQQVEEHLAQVDSPPAEPVAAEPVADLAFAEVEASAADSLAAAATLAAELPATEAVPAMPKTCVPVWEVDRFQWPVTVERLLGDQDGYFAQAGDKLLAAVRDGLKVMGITGSRRGEGRTTLALCLARAAAGAGIQVAIIDADFARPQLAAKIGLEVAHGWQEAAQGKIPLSEAAVKSLADNITVLPLEVSAAGAALSLADPRVTATLRAAAATFEFVIVDLGPLGAGDIDLFPADEACPLDAAIVVRDLRYASLAESRTIGERLYAAGLEAVGIAENFVFEEEAVSV